MTTRWSSAKANWFHGPASPLTVASFSSSCSYFGSKVTGQLMLVALPSWRSNSNAPLPFLVDAMAVFFGHVVASFLPFQDNHLLVGSLMIK